MVMLRKEAQDMKEIMWDGGYASAPPPRRQEQPPQPAPPPPLMDEALLQASNEPQRWKDCAASFAKALATVNMADAYAVSPAPAEDKATEERRAAAIAETGKLLRTMNNMRWPQGRQLYTLAQVDNDVLTLFCERRYLDWQTVFNAKAAFGAPADLTVIAEKAKLANATINVSHALPWAAKPQLLVQGFWHDGNLETTEHLFKMGADPSYDQGNALFATVVEQGRKDIGSLFARYGQNGMLDVNYWAQWARQQRKMKLYSDLRDIGYEYGDFHKVDNTTLQQTKTLADGQSQMKVLFNFAAQRVTEILDTTNPRQTVVKDFTFDEYGRPALEEARAKLIEYGGHPPEIGATLAGKPQMPGRIAPQLTRRQS